MIVYILMSSEGEAIMTYSKEELATSQIPLVEVQYAKNTGKQIKIVKVTKNKVDLSAEYSGLPEDHF